MNKEEIADLYFLDARARLIDIAAYMDRMERSPGTEDFRYKSFKQSIELLKSPLEGKTRTESILESFSDLSAELSDSCSCSLAMGAPRG